ncbi:MAG: NAD(P)/FAD-dependent oxidoreductase [Clostridia bacterium]|nr:NAD(P)/FAD-dependent oxidoreductase [Clostridia bacterium]MBO7288778.1 NAD(P)/FAD-dependent oxidoreductase [Clostridia bacterium]
MEYQVAVVGGGAAGLMASYIASKSGKKVCLIEKNTQLGKKILITGKGRCNVTNSAPTEDFIANTAVNANFLYSAFYSFTNTDLMNMLENAGLKLKTERGGRVFPQSDKASDVRNTLQKLTEESGTHIIFDEVKKITKENENFVIKLGKQTVMARSVIIATGGVSYPLTGSTGDGYKFAKGFGHTIAEPKASLVPLVTKEKYVADIMGLSLKNIAVKLSKNNKEIYSDFGEMLFTHFGISGPVILSSSSHIRDNGEYKISIDLKPALDFKTLDSRILRDFELEKNKDFINSLDALLPKKLIPLIVKLSGIDERQKVNSITREQRHNLVKLLKNFEFTIIGKRPISEAIITSGGINVKEIDSSTMESKLVPGLFFAGEVIDVDAYTGGFNLQIAFSTAYLAGINS